MSIIRIDIDAREVTKAIAQLKAYRKSKEEAVTDITRKNAIGIKELAQTLVPVDTFALRESIGVQMMGNDALIGSDLHYAIYVEMGTGIYAVGGNGRKTPWRYYYRGNQGPHGWRWTRGQKPQPYMVPAWHSMTPVYLSELKVELGKVR